MLLAILLTLSSLPLHAPATPQDEVCAALRPILPDLLRIDSMHGGSSGYVVNNARVRTLEERLGKYLGLPPELRVKLTTGSDHRREVAKNGSITAWIHHRSSGMGLGHAVIAWSGESVRVPGLRFLMTETESWESHVPRAGRRHYAGTSLPVFYRRLGELADLVDSPRYAIEGIFSFSGSPAGDPPFGTATVGIRKPCDLGEKYLSVRATLPLGEALVPAAGGETPEPPWLDRPFAGPASRPGTVDKALDVGLEILEQLDFSFEHSIRLTHSRVEPLVYELRLDPYKKEHSPLPVSVRVHRGQGEDARWYVTDSKRQMTPEGVELRAFVALMNRIVPLQLQRGGQMGVLGLARGATAGEAKALFVTVDAESIWAAEKGQLFVLNASPDGETSVVEWDELPAIIPGEPVMFVREAVSRSGKGFHLYIPVRGDILMSHPPPRVLRYGELSFAPIGGNLSN